jgi:hypothetical protein
MTTFRFDWTKEPRDSFLNWFVPVAVGGSDIVALNLKDPDWTTHIELTMQVNGVEVNAQRFMERVRENMHYYAQSYAADLVNEIGRLDEATQILEDVGNHVRGEVINRLREHGVELPERDES